MLVLVMMLVVCIASSEFHYLHAVLQTYLVVGLSIFYSGLGGFCPW